MDYTLLNENKVAIYFYNDLAVVEKAQQFLEESNCVINTSITTDTHNKILGNYYKILNKAGFPATKY